EMVDSFSWKHWKSINQEADWDNLQIEVVDVWHFIISLAIENYTQNMRGTIDTLALDISELKSFDSINKKNSSFATQDEVMAKVEGLILLSLNKDNLELEKLIGEFFDLVVMSGLDLETLYRLYVGKNILNQFRQDNGYKDATYIKVWNGEEDNVIMKRVWEEDSDIQPDNLYKALEKQYATVTKS
ncbi:MAG: dUTP diphosphatase, partial [Campylobacterota bacterium]|nr:dUTP diphosphatase [Campylobacterota bacterium]